MADLSTSTAATLSAVDLSKLTFPEFLAPITYEQVLTEMLADVNQFCLSKTGEPYIFHEADPAHIIIEACAYRRWRDLQDYQAQTKNMLVAYAQNEWLDHLGSNSDFKCPRLVIIPADDSTTPPTPAIMESDDAYRARMVLRNEGYTTAGSAGAYLFHTLSADGDVRDASVQSPTPGSVLVTILSNSNDGAASATLIAKVQAALSADSVRPLCDQVTVQAANISTYSVSYTIKTYPGSDVPDVLSRSRAAVQAYCEAHFKLGHDITISGLIAAATVTGVQNVALTTPPANLVCDLSSAYRCTTIAATHSGGQL